MLSRQDILDLHDELVDLRQPEVSAWRDVAALIQPDQAVTPDGRGSTRMGEIFDGTGIVALDNFVGGIFGQLTNPANRWMGLGVSDDPELNEWPPVRQWLWDTATRLLATLNPASSGFYEEAGQWFADVGAFGNGVLCSQDIPGQAGFSDRAIPLGQCFWDVDEAGILSCFHREFVLRGRQFPRAWREALGESAEGFQEKREYTVVHAVRRSEDFRPGAIGPRGKRWRSLTVSRELKGLHVEAGFEEMPYHVIRWTKRGASAYGTGPGHRARADTAMLQEMERAHIVAAQRVADPSWLADNDSVVQASDIVPGRVLYGALVAENGRPLLQALNMGGNLQLTMQQSEGRRTAIRDAFYFGLMQLLQRPQMTATEFLGFQEEKLRLMGPNLVHIQTGGLSPFIVRRYAMLSRAGRLPPPPPELAERRLEVVYQSPLALAQKAAIARATLQLTQAVMGMSQIDPSVLDNLDMDAAVRILHDGYGPPPTLLRDPREVARMRQSRAGVDQARVALEMGGQATAIAAEAAHAQQATTLAEGRAA